MITIVGIICFAVVVAINLVLDHQKEESESIKSLIVEMADLGYEGSMTVTPRGPLLSPIVTTSWVKVVKVEEEEAE